MDKQKKICKIVERSFFIAIDSDGNEYELKTPNNYQQHDKIHHEDVNGVLHKYWDTRDEFEIHGELDAEN